MGLTDPFSGSEGWVRRYGTPPQFPFGAGDRGKMGPVPSEQAIKGPSTCLAAIEQGRFNREIVPLAGVLHDETPRQTSLEKMAELEFLFGCDRVTAAVSSQTCDAASAMLIVSEAALKRYGLTPRARIHHLSVRAEDPIWMLTAPIPATATHGVPA